MKCSLLKNFATAVLLVSAVAIVSCDNAAPESSDDDKDTAAATATDAPAVNAAESAEAVISGTYPDTAVTGTATFQTVNGKVKMVLNITAAAKANKTVAVHIHEHPGCGDQGKDAHGHWNPTKVNHGKWGSDAFHSGDIGNVELDKDGKGSKELETDRWTIGGDSTTNILNRSIIVHGGVDDFKTQPTGNAGNRIGCGIINKK
ncbi:MAG TPA: superoxide dismutase family protein [Flavitalea sp.]|nr:superoxide dismutase family protein [Flavitalea sp.]